MLVYRSLKHRAIKGMDNNSLPVYWRSTRKALNHFFEDWFVKCLCPEVEKYHKSQNLAFKVVLIVDNASGHLTVLGDLCENVKISVLPPNTASLLQPTDHRRLIRQLQRWTGGQMVWWTEIIQQITDLGVQLGFREIDN